MKLKLLYALIMLAMPVVAAAQMPMTMPMGGHNPVQLSSTTTPKDTIPDFCETPAAATVRDGEWSDAGTWGGTLPQSGDVVRVGHTVTFSGRASVKCLGVTGWLKFLPAANTSMTAGDIIVYREGRLHVGTAAAPITGTAEIVISSKPIDTARDPLRFGTVFLVFGELQMHGAAKTPTWARLTQEAVAGAASLTVGQNLTGWTAGDRLLLPDTRQLPLAYQGSTVPPVVLPLNIETPVLAQSQTCGTELTLAAPLAANHLSGKKTDGSVIAYPHVANLSRNVVVRSELPTGTRGHAMFTERAKIDIRYVQFSGLGRTTKAPLSMVNQIGRYPVHFHHLMGPLNPTNTGYQFVFVGNAVDDCLKWCIAVHNSHWGLVADNVMFDAQGAAIMTEQGNERENVFERNIAVKVGDMINTPQNPTYGGVSGPGRTLGHPAGWGDFGWEGSAFWFTGNDNYVRDNVAANVAFAGIMYNARSPSGFASHRPVVPLFRGADIANPLEWDDYRKEQRWYVKPAPSIRESVRNEVYASNLGGWIGFAAVVGTLKDDLYWNIRQQGVYYGRNVSGTLENFRIFADQNVSNEMAKIYVSGGMLNVGLDFGATTYNLGGIQVKNVHVEGFNRGMILPANTDTLAPWPGEVTVDGGYFRNYLNVLDQSPHSNKTTVLRDVTFVQNTGPVSRWLAPTPLSVLAKIEDNTQQSNITGPSRLLIYNLNGTGENVEFYAPHQAPDFKMLTRANPASNCPTAGMTNQQCWDAHKVTTLGRVAPCSATRPEFMGFVCPAPNGGGH